MPIYQYECEKCGHKFDLRRSIAEDDNELACPKCGAMRPKRIITAFSAFSSGGSCAPTGGG